MVLFNYSTKELTAKIVYYGPGLCGKTTNLEFIYESLPEEKRGRMLSLSTQTDRTLYFDFLPVELGDIRGMTTRVQLYTVPGQVFYDETRRMVLKGVDGVVFVADSQAAMADANQESFKNLHDNLKLHGLDLAEMPMVLQFNKRDLPDIQTVEEMNAALNNFNAPFYEAIATTGIGVHDTLKAISKLVLRSLTARYEGSQDDRPVAASQGFHEDHSPLPEVEHADPMTPPVPADAVAASPLPASDDWECADLENELDQMDATEIQGLLEEVDGFDEDPAKPMSEPDAAYMSAEQTGDPDPVREPSRQEASLAGEAGDDFLFSTPAAAPAAPDQPDEDGSVWMGAPEGMEAELVPGASADLDAALARDELEEDLESAPAANASMVSPDVENQRATPVAKDLPDGAAQEPGEAAALTFENFLEQTPLDDPLPGATEPAAASEIATPVPEASDGPALVPGVPEKDGNGDLRVPLHLQIDGREHLYILTLSLQAVGKDPA